MPLKKEIVYPIILECSQYANDTFWETVFEDLAYGKAPYGTYISKDFLCCNYKKKEFSYKIEKKRSDILYKEIYDLLNNKLGLLSQQESVKRKKAFVAIEENIKESRKCWGGIRKKNMKELLLELFITNMKNKYFLTIKQARYLLSVIMIALVFKVITIDDIDYRNGKIYQIDGIHFTKKNVDIERDIYNLDISFTPSISKDKKLMSEEWDKYLKNLRKI